MEPISRLVTPPKSFKTVGKGKAVLGLPGRCFCRVENEALRTPLSKQGAKKIEDTLFSLLDDKPEGKKVVIRLVREKAPSGIKNADQGYKISVRAREITLTGFGSLGLFYACVSFCQLLRADENGLSLPSLDILDYPDTEVRGHLLESRYGTNKMELCDWKQVVDDMTEKKENTLVVALYGCWSIQYDGQVSEYVYYPFKKYPKLKTPVVTRYYSPSKKAWIDETGYPPIFEKNFFGELAAYAKEHGISVVPIINSYGHNTHIPFMYPEVSAKFPDGTPTGNGFCTSEKATYDLLFGLYDDIIDNVLKPLGLTAFEIGLDEIGDDEIGVRASDPFGHYPVFCRCEKCEKAGKTRTQKYVDHAIKLISHLKERGMKTVYICGDMFYRANRPKEQNYLPMFYEALEKAGLTDIVAMIFWAYSDVQSHIDANFKADVFKDMPIRYRIQPMNGYYHWNIVRHSVKNAYLMGKLANEVKPYSYIAYASWDKSFDRTNSLIASYAWGFEDAGDVDAATLKYAERLFPENAAKAARGFRLLDVINAEAEVEETNTDHMNVARKKLKTLSTRTLMERYLAYYFYSYLREGMEYPEDFPTRAVKTLVADRELCEKTMRRVLRDAKAAEKVFRELSHDPSGDTVAANRYAADAAHYVCLLEDYFAILRMHDLAKEPSEETVAEMKRETDLRIKERLDFMRRYESAKEPYLMAMHMRNMSIYLQFFLDLKSYLENTPIEDFRLDFENLSPIASEQFKKLR